MAEFLRDWKPDGLIRILVSGRFKTGKTWGALTFPRVNVLDFDRGVGVAGNPEFIAKHGRRDFLYEQFTEKGLNSRGVPLTHNAFDDACRYFDKSMAASERDRFDTWIVDSGTTLGSAAANKAIVLLGGKEITASSQTHAQAIKTGLISMKQQDFGSERSLVEQFVDMLLSTDKHVVLLAHEKELMTDSGAIVGIVPLFTGQSIERIPLKFDEVYRLTAKKSGPEIVRTLQTHTDGIVKCGTRVFGMPDSTLWDYDSIMKHVSTLKPPSPLATLTAA